MTDQYEMNFNPPFPELKFESWKKVVTERAVTINGIQFDAGDFLNYLGDILEADSPEAVPFIWGTQREVLESVGACDSHGILNWPRLEEFFDYLAKSLHREKEKDEDYYLDGGPKYPLSYTGNRLV